MATLSDVLRPYVPSTLWTWSEPGVQIIDGSLVSADISGFTALAERLADVGREGSEQLTAILNDRFAAMIAHVDRHGGDVLKFGGDALLCLFTDADHAARATAASIAMRAELSRPVTARGRSKVQLSVSTGIHSGQMPLFLVDSGYHHELLVLGDEPSITVEAESTAGRNEILVSRATEALLPAGTCQPHADDPTFALVITDVEADVLADAPVRIPALREAPTVESLERCLPPSQVSRIRHSSTADGEHRSVAVLFVSFSSTGTFLDARAATTEHQRLTTLIRRAGEICDRYGVSYLASDIKPGGGKMILAAGAPKSTGHDPDAALHCARDLSHELGALGLRIGVAHGHIFVGDLGGPTRRTYTVMGDSVNLSARLMSAAEPGQAIATRALLDAAEATFPAEPLPPFMVKGKSIEIHAAVIDAGTAGGTSNEAHERSRASEHFVGRTAELGTLTEAWQQAVARNGSTHALIADVGAGKTELVDQLIHKVAPELLLRARGDVGTRARPYAVMRSILRSATGIPLNARPEEAGVQLLGALRRHVPTRAALAPIVARTLDAEVPMTPEASRVLPEFAGSLATAVVAELLAAVLTQPTLIVIEDLETADAASIEMVEQLFTGDAAAVVNRPWLVVLASRDATSVPESVERIPLEPLTTSELEALVVAMTPRPLRPADVAAIVVKSGGNPLFAIELATADADVDDLPATVEAAVAARLDRLEPAIRERILQVAVLGGDVNRTVLEGSLGIGGAGSAWADASEFVHVTDERVTFNQTIYSEVAYQLLSFRRRRRLHDQVARWIQEHQPDDVSSMSTHFAGADVAPEAWKYSVLAAEDALASFSNTDAVRLYLRALRFGRRAQGVSTAEIGRVEEALGDVAEVAGQYETSAQAYKHSQRRFGGELPASVRLQRKLGVLQERAANYSGALRIYGRALSRIEREAPAARAILAGPIELAYAGVRYHQGRYDDCVTWAKRAERDALISDDARSLAHAYLLQDITETYRGRPSNFAQKAAVLFRRVGDLLYEAHSINNLGVAAYFAGDWATAIEHYLASADTMATAGAATWSGTSRNNVAEVYSDQGRLDLAEEQLDAADRIFHAVGYTLGIHVARENRGRVRLRQGRLDEATTMLTESREKFVELGTSYYVHVADLWLAEAELAQNDPDAAVTRAEELLAGGELGDPNLEAGAQRVLGTAEAILGDHDAAAEHLGSALDSAVRANSVYEQGLIRLVLAALPDAPGAAGHLKTGAGLLADLGVVTELLPPGLEALRSRQRDLAR